MIPMPAIGFRSRKGLLRLAHFLKLFYGHIMVSFMTQNTFSGRKPITNVSRQVKNGTNIT